MTFDYDSHDGVLDGLAALIVVAIMQALAAAIIWALGLSWWWLTTPFGLYVLAYAGTWAWLHRNRAPAAS